MSPDLFKWLLEKGFDINETTMKGRTPMDIAKLYCRAHIVDYIKKASK
jgi:ankyrin repeat protein